MIVISSLVFHVLAAFSFRTLANAGFASSKEIRAKHIVGAGLGRTGKQQQQQKGKEKYYFLASFPKTLTCCP